jgi:ribose transport system substrate-binding protein
VKRTLILLLTLALLTGCPAPEDSGSTTAPDGNKRYRIAVIPKGTTHEFWKSVHYGAQQAAKELGNVDVLWLGPREEGDRDGQITVVQNFVTKQVDGIVLAPLDSQGLVRPVRDAVNQDIPVVIFDSSLDDESLIVSYVATDNRVGGELAAEEMAQRLDGKGKVILLRYTTGSASTQQREEGFLDKLKDYPGIEVISSDQYAGTTPESSLDKAQQILDKYRNEVDGIFAVCEPNANGVLAALENANLDREIVFIGFDPNQRMVDALASGKMQGIVLQDPVKMGYLAVKHMVAHLEGEEVEKVVSTGEYIATPENMQEEQMQKLLNPPQFDE